MAPKKNDEKLFDIRTLDAYQSRGVVKPAEFDKYLKALPDDEGNYDIVLIEEDEEILEEEAEDEEE
jgi:hypothetical protein